MMKNKWPMEILSAKIKMVNTTVIFAKLAFINY